LDKLTIHDLILTPLKRISHAKGDIYHAIKKSDAGYAGFGEAYFSSVIAGEIKGWKKHTQMTLNLVVPVGAIRFVVYDPRDESPSKNRFDSVVLSAQNYARLTVPPGLFVGFQGVGTELNLLLNLASIEHDPMEAENLPLDQLDFNWSPNA